MMQIHSQLLLQNYKQQQLFRSNSSEVINVIVKIILSKQFIKQCQCYSIHHSLLQFAFVSSLQYNIVLLLILFEYVSFSRLLSLLFECNKNCLGLSVLGRISIHRCKLVGFPLQGKKIWQKQRSLPPIVNKGEQLRD